MNNIIIDKNWKLFTLSDVFEISRGKRYKKEDHMIGIYNYVSSKDTNNGVDGKVSLPTNGRIYQNVLAINNSGSVGKVFYHNKPSIFSDHVTVLELKNYKLNENIAMFLIPILEKLKIKYQFGREMNNERLGVEQILLPTINDDINWKAMETYIISLKKEYTPELSSIEKSYDESKYLTLDYEKWAEFKIGDLFELKNGIKYPAESRKKGNVPLVSTSSVNNGVSDYIEYRDGVYANILSVAYSGSVGEVFYHATDVFIGETVFAMLPKFELNQYIAMFLIPILRLNNQRYDFGRKIKGSKYVDDEIKLPVKNGIPDWDFMETYIKNCSYTSKI